MPKTQHLKETLNFCERRADALRVKSMFHVYISKAI